MAIVATPEDDNLHLDLTFTGRERNYLRPLALVSAIVAIAGIVALMTTDVASRVLPMNDEYLQVLVPRAPDGKEALSLKTLDHEIVEKTLRVRGTIGNRTEFPVAGLVAVIEAHDVVYGPPQTVEVPVEPAEIPSMGDGSFQASITLPEKPSGYSLKFRLADGPFVPHRDDRAATYGFGDK